MYHWFTDGITIALILLYFQLIFVDVKGSNVWQTSNTAVTVTVIAPKDLQPDQDSCGVFYTGRPVLHQCHCNVIVMKGVYGCFFTSSCV